jgi:hypothetical protein
MGGRKKKKQESSRKKRRRRHNFIQLWRREEIERIRVRKYINCAVSVFTKLLLPGFFISFIIQALIWQYNLVCAPKDFEDITKTNMSRTFGSRCM